ncbi:MAG: DNA repair protein RadC [Candidatus Pacebacteria bacterium]|nr:DNA repair protein RadC [Candidatus Paceibacterota bacterium]
MYHSTQIYKQTDTDLLTNTSETAYVLKLRDLPLDEKPRERLIAHGPQALSTAELLAVLLNVGTKKEEVMAMAKRIISEYGEKTIASERNVRRLQAELDLPETKSCQIVAAFELGRRFYSNGTGRSVIFRTPAQVYDYLKDMGSLPKEQLRGLYLNTRYQLIHDEIISIGSVTANIVHPREVFRPAIEYNASAVILAHNHPSGDSTPSAEDITITKQLTSAAEMIGIELLDHIVIGSNSYTSILNK